MYGEAPYGSLGYGEVVTDVGVPIIPAVTLITTELVFLIEIDLIQPQQDQEE